MSAQCVEEAVPLLHTQDLFDESQSTGCSVAAHSVSWQIMILAFADLIYAVLFWRVLRILSRNGA